MFTHTANPRILLTAAPLLASFFPCTAAQDPDQDSAQDTFTLHWRVIVEKPEKDFSTIVAGDLHDLTVISKAGYLEFSKEASVEQVFEEVQKVAFTPEKHNRTLKAGAKLPLLVYQRKSVAEAVEEEIKADSKKKRREKLLQHKWTMKLKKDNDIWNVKSLKENTSFHINRKELTQEQGKEKLFTMGDSAKEFCVSHIESLLPCLAEKA